MNHQAILFGLAVPKDFPNQDLAVGWVGFQLGGRDVVIMEAMSMKTIKTGLSGVFDDVPRIPASKVK